MLVRHALRNLICVNTITNMKVTAKIWKQGNVEIRVLCVALWKYRQAHGNVNLQCNGIAKVIKKSSQKAPS